MKKLLLLIVLVSNVSFGQSLREIYQEGMKAYEEKNYQLFKEKMYTIDTMRPNYPPVVYNLAGGYALTGNPEASIQTLRKYILMDATQDFSADSDFESITDTDGFSEIVKLQKELTRELPVQAAYEFPILASHSECITWSKKQKAFFMGGVRDGKIWKVKDGEQPVVWAESPENSWAVMGIEVSADEKTLWACTSAMDNFKDLNEEDKGKVSVLKYDLKKGELIETFSLPPNHNFGDLILDSSGNVYLSDGTANQLWWISRETGKLEMLKDFSGTILNMQGLTFNKDESAIYLSDYIDGIYKFTLGSGSVQKLSATSDVLLKGIDGLYRIGNVLIGLHNGTKPNRIVKYFLDDQGTDILKKEIVAQDGILGEPTQGTVLNGTLFYISNSPWTSYDQEGNFNIKEENIIIGQIK